VRLITSSRGQIEVHEWGAGRSAIVLLHAAASGPRALSRLAEAMAKHGVRVLAPALAGYGDTFTAGDADAIGAHVVVARAVLDDVDAERVALFGHSMGGLVALRTALAVRAEVSVIAYEPVAFGALDRTRQPDATAAGWDRRIAEQLIDAVARGEPEAGVAAFVEAWNEVRWAALPEAARRSLVSAASRLAAEVACVSRDATPASAYAALGHRLTLLRGTHSPDAVRLIADRIAAATPGSTLVEMADAGHMAPVMQTDAVADAILSTLRPSAP